MFPSFTRRQSSSTNLAASTRPTLQSQAQSMNNLSQNINPNGKPVAGFFGGLGGMGHSMIGKDMLKDKENLNIRRPVLTNITNRQLPPQLNMKSSVVQSQKPTTSSVQPLVRRLSYANDSSQAAGPQPKTEEEVVEMLTRLQQIHQNDDEPVSMNVSSTENDEEENDMMEITQSGVLDEQSVPEPVLSQFEAEAKEAEIIEQLQETLQQDLQSNNATPQKQEQESGSNKNTWNVIKVQKSPGIDTLYQDQPKYCSEIVKEMISNMKECEIRYSVPEGWLDPENTYLAPTFANFKMISPYAREKLVDEVLKFCYEQGFTTPTLFLAINYLDRFIFFTDTKFTTDSEVFTAALVCAWIAAKYEEIHPPSAGNIASMYKLKKSSFLDAEMQVLSTLKYNCTVSTCYPFLKRFLHTDMASLAVTQVAFFLAQMTLMYAHFSPMKPSKIAGAVLYVARMIMNETNSTSQNLTNGTTKNFSSFFGTSYALKCPNTNFQSDPKYWSNHAEYYTGYELKEIFPEICAILKMMSDFEKNPKSRVIPQVFSDKKKGYACLRVRNFMRAKGKAMGF